MVTKKEQILKLHSEGKSAEDIAEIVGTTINSVKSTLSRNRTKGLGQVSSDTISKDKTKKIIKPIKKEEPKLESIKSTYSIKDTNDLKHLIPKSNGYISRNIFGTTDIKVLEGLYKDKKSTLLIGETGCGKTHAIRHFCYKHKLPYKRLNLNGGTTAEDLVGQFIPTKDGGFKWVDGWLTKFAKLGGVIVLDEINGCSAEILFALHSITDDERTLTLTQKNGETIKAHNNLWIVATMNPDYEGTKPLNVAFKDRFRVIPWDYDVKVEEKIGIPNKIIKIATQLREMYKLGDLSHPVSTRMLIQYVEDVKLVGKKPAKALFCNKFSNEIDQKAVLELFDLGEKGSKVTWEKTKKGFLTIGDTIRLQSNKSRIGKITHYNRDYEEYTVKFEDDKSEDGFTYDDFELQVIKTL